MLRFGTITERLCATRGLSTRCGFPVLRLDSWRLTAGATALPVTQPILLSAQRRWKSSAPPKDGVKAAQTKREISTSLPTAPPTEDTVEELHKQLRPYLLHANFEAVTEMDGAKVDEKNAALLAFQESFWNKSHTHIADKKAEVLAQLTPASVYEKWCLAVESVVEEEKLPPSNAESGANADGTAHFQGKHVEKIVDKFLRSLSISLKGDVAALAKVEMANHYLGQMLIEKEDSVPAEVEAEMQRCYNRLACDADGTPRRGLSATGGVRVARVPADLREFLPDRDEGNTERKDLKCFFRGLGNKSDNVLRISGVLGTGKSHLAINAAKIALAELHPGQPVDWAKTLTVFVKLTDEVNELPQFKAYAKESFLRGLCDEGKRKRERDVAQFLGAEMCKACGLSTTAVETLTKEGHHGNSSHKYFTNTVLVVDRTVYCDAIGQAVATSLPEGFLPYLRERGLASFFGDIHVICSSHGCPSPPCGTPSHYCCIYMKEDSNLFGLF